MNVFGVGGLELVVVMLIALFVVGPVRLVEGARTARKYLEEIRRQRDELTQMIEDAADLEGVKAALDQDGLIGEMRDAAAELTSFRDEAAAASDDLRELQDVVTTLRRPLGNRPMTPSTSIDPTATDSAAPDEPAPSGESAPATSSNGAASRAPNEPAPADAERRSDAAVPTGSAHAHANGAVGSGDADASGASRAAANGTTAVRRDAGAPNPTPAADIGAPTSADATTSGPTSATTHGDAATRTGDRASMP